MAVLSIPLSMPILPAQHLLAAEVGRCEVTSVKVKDQKLIIEYFRKKSPEMVSCIAASIVVMLIIETQSRARYGGCNDRPNHADP